MKLALDVNTFAKAVAGVQRVVEKRNTIPILSNILIDAEQDRVILRATDLDIQAEAVVDCEIVKPGSITVDAHRLHDIMRRLPAEAEASFEMKDNQMVLKSGRSRFALNVLPAADFPSLAATTENAKTFAVKGVDLRKIIAGAEFAISTEETRFYLNGVYLHALTIGNRKVLRAVATDGHRLAQIQMDAPEGAEELHGVIVPRKTVGEIIRLLDGKDEDEIRVSIDQSRIVIAVGDHTLTSKLIDGTFPDYDRVVPKNNDKVLTMDCVSFQKAVDRVSTISSVRGRAVKLKANDGKLGLSTVDSDTGSADDEIEVEYQSDPIEIGFNSQYLIEMAGQIKSGNAQFVMADPGSPTLIRIPDNDDVLYVLMPMRV